MIRIARPSFRQPCCALCSTQRYNLGSPQLFNPIGPHRKVGVRWVFDYSKGEGHTQTIYLAQRAAGDTAGFCRRFCLNFRKFRWRHNAKCRFSCVFTLCRLMKISNCTYLAHFLYMIYSKHESHKATTLRRSARHSHSNLSVVES